MKMASRLLFGGALLQLAGHTVGMPNGGSDNSGNLNSCSKQNNCLDITVTPVDLGDTHCILTGECFYEACITINLGGECAKDSTDTFSHICDQSDDNNCPNPASAVVSTKPQWDADKVEGAGPGELTKQCQIGAAGTALQFLYKDGDGCGDSLTADDVDGAHVTCRPSQHGALPNTVSEEGTVRHFRSV